MSKADLMFKLVEQDYDGFSVVVKPSVTRLASALSKGIIKLRKSGDDIIVFSKDEEFLFKTNNFSLIACIVDSIL